MPAAVIADLRTMAEQLEDMRRRLDRLSPPEYRREVLTFPATLPAAPLPGRGRR
jgi:hypothetical protein